MSKVKSKKTVEIEIPQESSDDEIQLPVSQQITKISKKATVIPPEPDSESEPEPEPVVPKKVRKPYTMSEETRKKKSEAMIAVRAKKQELVEQRRAERQILIKRDEEKLQKIIEVKYEKEKKKRVKDAIVKLVSEEVKTKPGKKSQVEEDSDSESEIEEVYVKKTRKPRTKKAVADPVPEVVHYQQPTRPNLQYF